MAEWRIVEDQEILRVSNKIEDTLNEIRDCTDKKQIEVDKLKNINSVIVMTSAFQPKRAKKLEESRISTLRRIGMIDSALEVLETQTHKA